MIEGNMGLSAVFHCVMTLCILGKRSSIVKQAFQRHKRSLVPREHKPPEVLGDYPNGVFQRRMGRVSSQQNRVFLCYDIASAQESYLAVCEICTQGQQSSLLFVSMSKRLGVMYDQTAVGLYNVVPQDCSEQVCVLYFSSHEEA